MKLLSYLIIKSHTKKKKNDFYPSLSLLNLKTRYIYNHACDNQTSTSITKNITQEKKFKLY